MAQPATAEVEGSGDGNKSKVAGRKPSYLCGTSCFRPSAAGDGTRTAEPAAGGDAGRERRIPTHLVVTVNGIIGSADNWRYAAKQFVKRYPEDVIVHCSKCNHSTLTFDGIDIMGDRLAKEVLSVIARRPELQKISFLGHSLGGLVARYAIGLLYGKSGLRDSAEDNEEYMNHKDGTEFLERKSEGKIAGLEPINFITFATPHLGSGFHKQIPILSGSYALEKMAYRISWIAGRTGKQLFLKDIDEGKSPLLLQMVNDCGDLQFISALRSFRCRVAYSNVCSDFIVGWKTSSIRYQHDLPKPENFMKNAEYPHVVYVEKPKASRVSHENDLESTANQQKTTIEIEEAMIKCLNRVPWERVDVSFRKSKQRILAHSTIQVKTYAVNSDGADVVFHMIDNFLT